MPVSIKQIRNLGLSLSLLMLVISACNKKSTPTPQQCCSAGTPPTLFEVLDDSGKGMILSLKDSVVISYADSDKTKSFTEPIAALDPTLIDATDYANFNGFVIKDEYGLASLSTRSPIPIHYFNLRVNGHDLGLLYFDYEDYLNTKSQSTTTAFTLTELAAKNITTSGKSIISTLQAK